MKMPDLKFFKQRKSSVGVGESGARPVIRVVPNCIFCGSRAPEELVTCSNCGALLNPHSAQSGSKPAALPRLRILRHMRRREYTFRTTMQKLWCIRSVYSSD